MLASTIFDRSTGHFVDLGTDQLHPRSKRWYEICLVIPGEKSTAIFRQMASIDRGPGLI